MVPKIVFKSSYIAGLAAGITLSLADWGKTSIPAFIPGDLLAYLPSFHTALWMLGIFHVIALAVMAVFIEEGYKSGSGVDLQYAGYLWTLIGVMAMLTGMNVGQSSADMLAVFLRGAGLAVSTSIVGWFIGRELESRGQVSSLSAAESAAEDLARTLVNIDKNLALAGTSLVSAVRDSVGHMSNLKAESAEAAEIVGRLCSNLEKSSVALAASIESVKSNFDSLVPTAKAFEASMTTGLGKIENSVKKLSGMGDQAHVITEKMGALVEKVKENVTAVSSLTLQTKMVIEQVGKFISTVFDRDLRR